MSLKSSLQIGEIIHNAIAFNMKNWQGGPMNSDSLIQTVQNLFSILEQRQVEYVLVGGIALLHYVEGRNTQDLDLLMALPALENLPEIEIASQDTYFARVGIYENDVAMLLYYYQPEVEKLLDELSRFVSESDLREIRDIVRDVQNRTRRFRRDS